MEESQQYDRHGEVKAGWQGPVLFGVSLSTIRASSSIVLLICQDDKNMPRHPPFKRRVSTALLSRIGTVGGREHFLEGVGMEMGR